MFGFGKDDKEPSPAAADEVPATMSLLSDEALATFTDEAIRENTHPTVLACTLIALENFEIVRPGYASVFGFSKDYHQQCERLADLFFVLRQRQENSSDSIEREILSRKTAYLFKAGALKCLGARARKNPALVDDLATLWLVLAEGASSLAKTLNTIQLWTADEKRIFSEVKNERDGEQYFRLHLLPKALWDHPKMEAWDERGLPPHIASEIRGMFNKGPAAE